MLSTSGSQKYGVAKPKKGSSYVMKNNPIFEAPAPAAPLPEKVVMNRLGAVDVEKGPAATAGGDRSRGSFIDWTRRNWIPLGLLLFGLLGVVMAMLWLFKPCPKTTNVVSAPVDIVINLDGSGSVDGTELKQLMKSSGMMVEEIATNISDLRVGVTQWGSGSPRTELGFPPADNPGETQRAINRLKNDIAFSRLPNKYQNTWFSTAFGACWDQHANWYPRNEYDSILPVYPLCVIVSDGQNFDAGKVYSPDSQYNSPVVLNFCKYTGLDGNGANKSCMINNIADTIKNVLNITVFGLYIGNNQNHKRALCDVSSCSPEECEQDRCEKFATATNFADVQAKSRDLADTLLIDIPSSTTQICIDEPFGLLFLLFFLPLGLYLFWRPLTIIAAKYISPKTQEELRRASTARESLHSPIAPGGAKRFRWSIKAADAYLWDLGGAGCRPLGVNFGDAVPPSAPKADQRRESNNVLRKAFTWEPKARNDVYRADEVGPGDIDYEYTVCLMRCCPCLRPNDLSAAN